VKKVVSRASYADFSSLREPVTRVLRNRNHSKKILKFLIENIFRAKKYFSGKKLFGRPEEIQDSGIHLNAGKIL